MSNIHINPDKCIACTICQVYCPVARVTPKFLGPRLIGPAYERFRLLGVEEEETLHYCANCKNCDISCPHGVPITALNMIARGKQKKQAKYIIRDWILGHGGFLASTLKLFPAFLKNFGMLNPLTRIILDVCGISKKADLPAFDKYFRTKYKGYKQPECTKEVVFFPGCYIDAYDYNTGLDIIWVLNKAGYKVIVPDAFKCCGLPMVSNGFFEDARKNAKVNLEVLKEYKAKNIPIVTGCPSCALMFKKDVPEYYPELIFDGYVGCVRDVQEFILNEIENGRLNIPKNGKNTEVLYHAPCHLRAQGSGLTGYDFLKTIPALNVADAQAGCCGISGSYGFKKEKYDIGMEIGSELFDKVKRSSAVYIASECGTCRVQIEHGAGRKAIHPITILKRALNGEL